MAERRLIPIVELTLVRLREFLREPEAVFWVFAFPLLMAFALGIAFRNERTQEVVVGVVRAEGRPSASSSKAPRACVCGRWSRARSMGRCGAARSPSC